METKHSAPSPGSITLSSSGVSLAFFLSSFSPLRSPPILKTPPPKAHLSSLYTSFSPSSTGNEMMFQNFRFSAFYRSRFYILIIFNPLGKLEKTCLSCSLERGPGGMSLIPLTKCLHLDVTRAALMGNGGPSTPNSASRILYSDPCPSPTIWVPVSP